MGSPRVRLTYKYKQMDNSNDILFTDILEAYFCFRKGKKNTDAALAFKVNYEEYCFELWREIVERRYSPGPSNAFIINKPVKREIFAATFRDRICHCYIGMRLTPLFENVFIDETTSCRKGKGTTYGINQLFESIWRVSNGYTSDCWILKLDIKSFFMCINKSLLWERLQDFIKKHYLGNDIETLLYLTEIILMNDPTKNCRLRSPQKDWKDIPKHKSLFTSEKGFGLAPGNLTSQIEANFFLNPFDHWMKERFSEYGRYVDDFYVVGTDREELASAIPDIKDYLQTLGLTLHPDKIYLQHYTKGVKYIGAVLKGNRKYISNRTVGNLYSAIHRFNKCAEKEGYVDNNALRFTCCINSYFGFLRQYSSYALRRKAVRRITRQWWKAIYISGHFEKVVVKKKYRTIYTHKC